MSKNIIETIVGALVLVLAVYFVFTALSKGTEEDPDSYELIAKFDRIDGLAVGSDVRVSGLNVGKILEQTIEDKTYLAVVKFSVDERVELPKDSSAEIIGDGLLGSKYLALIPGGAEDNMEDGDQVQFTQPAISIESLIGKFVFGSADDKKGQEEEKKEEEDDGLF